MNSTVKTSLICLASGLGILLLVGACTRKPVVVAPDAYRPGYQAQSARICDPDNVTRTWDDDCDRISGYYIHPTFGYGFYSPGMQPIIIDRSVSGSNYRPGRTYTFSNPRTTPPISQTTRAPQITAPASRPPARSSGTNFSRTSGSGSSVSRPSAPSSGRSGTSFSGGGKGGAS